MQDDQIIKHFEQMTRELAVEQRDHLARGRVERTLTGHLAAKLAPFFIAENLTVDPFYNKHGDAAKRLNGQVIELDIAVHRQGFDDHNLVAIELETNNKPERDDVWKLEGLTRKLEGYGYQLGLFVVFGIHERAGEVLTLEWYRNGKRFR